MNLCAKCCKKARTDGYLSHPVLVIALPLEKFLAKRAPWSSLRAASICCKHCPSTAVNVSPLWDSVSLFVQRDYTGETRKLLPWVTLCDFYKMLTLCACKMFYINLTFWRRRDCLGSVELCLWKVWLIFAGGHRKWSFRGSWGLGSAHSRTGQTPKGARTPPVMVKWVHTPLCTPIFNSWKASSRLFLFL